MRCAVDRAMDNKQVAQERQCLKPVHRIFNKISIIKQKFPKINKLSRYLSKIKQNKKLNKYFA